MEKLNINAIAKQLRDNDIGTSILENEKIIKGAIEKIKDALVDGDEVSLYGLGTFSVRDVEERTGRNPQTGEEITIPAHKSPKFKFSQVVKDIVK